jgi:hypothetical protein
MQLLYLYIYTAIGADPADLSSKIVEDLDKFSQPIGVCHIASQGI